MRLKSQIALTTLAANILVITILIFILISCHQNNNNNINNKRKRNANWEWWVDRETGKGEWIALGGDSSTLKNGRYTTFYYNGEKCEEGQLLNGKKTDTFFAFNLKGELDFYRIADLDSTIYFLKDGFRKVYYRDGKLLGESQIKNHNYYGILINYYKNGNKKFVRNYVKDSGWGIQYYENGQIKDSSLEFNNSGKGRICKSWFENGQIKSIVNWNWKTGKQEGNTKMFYETANKLESVIKSSVDWNNGFWNGVTLLYYQNGKLSDSINFVEGKYEGVGKSWDEKGKLKLINLYKQDSLINSKSFDEK